MKTKKTFHFIDLKKASCKHYRKFQNFFLSLNGSDKNSERVSLLRNGWNGIPSIFIFHGMVQNEIIKFQVFFSSAKWFGTEFWAVLSSVKWFGTEFRIFLSSAERFGTECRALSVLRNRRNSDGMN
jgi:hypothetical protein